MIVEPLFARQDGRKALLVEVERIDLVSGALQSLDGRPKKRPVETRFDGMSVNDMNAHQAACTGLRPSKSQALPEEKS